MWNPDGGRTAAEISCDSDLLLLLLLQDLCRAAPLPPLLPEHTGIPFNSLFLPVVKPPYRHLTATVRTAPHYPSVGGTTFLLKCQDVKYAVWKWREGAFNAPPPPIPTRCAFTKCGVNKSSERLDELELHLHQTPADDMSELRSLLPPPRAELRFTACTKLFMESYMIILSSCEHTMKGTAIKMYLHKSIHK